MSDRIDEESAERALDIALGTIRTFEMDGEDPAIIFSIFAIGGAICAQMHDVSKETYLEGCEKFYLETTKFLKDLGLKE
jgi:hypothetical protein